MALTPELFHFICDLVRRDAGIVLEDGKEYLVESRLLPLARAAGIATTADYVAALRTRPTPDGRGAVVDALTTNETFWFRDQDPFEALTRVVVPELSGRPNPRRKLRIWSAACSSGQEPYSIAMLMAELLLPLGWSAEIVATDISPTMLDRARAGTYSQLEVGRGLPASMLSKYFRRCGTQWQVSDDIRSMVTVAPLNLTQPLPVGSPFDIVFLRNVLIYFDTPTKSRIMRQVRQVTTPGGFMFLGAAETTLGVDDAWERVPLGRFTLNRAPALNVPAAAAAPVMTLARNR
ncbi:MAG: protein-glutamate O-methyltransferase CheR [Actinomycetota bacterium]|nr:protein-glutamate O-methyltransferase CheR [Actinomycetota bacterium]